MNTQLQFTAAEPRYRDQVDTPRMLSEVLAEFESRVLSVPVYQRGMAWNAAKRADYVRALFGASYGGGARPIGVIVTCQIRGEGDQIWLVDGLQRLSALEDLRLVPERYGQTAESVAGLLRSVTITCQHRIYDSPNEAYTWFQRVNQGTALTSWEFYKGLIALVPGYEAKIEPALYKIEQAIANAQASLGIAEKSRQKRDKVHRLRRHAWLLLLRYLTNDHTANSYELSGEHSWEKSAGTIEARLARWIEANGIEAFERAADQFCGIVVNHAGMLRAHWVMQDGYAMNPTLYRWHLEVEVYRRLIGRSTQEYAGMLGQLNALWRAPGNLATQIRLPERDRPLTIQLGKGPTDLSLICERIGSNFPKRKEPRRNSSNGQARLGYHLDHYDQPYATHGNGPVRPVPAAENMARGAALPGPAQGGEA